MAPLRTCVTIALACAGVLTAPLPASAHGPSRATTRPIVSSHLSFSGFSAGMPAGAVVSVIQTCPSGSRLDERQTRAWHRELDITLGGEPGVPLASRAFWVAGLVSRYRVVRTGGVPTADGFGLVDGAVCTGRVSIGARTVTGRASTDVRVWGPAPAGVEIYSFGGPSVSDAGDARTQAPYLTTASTVRVASSRGALAAGVRADREADDPDAAGIDVVRGTLRRPVPRGRFVSMQRTYTYTADLTRREPEPGGADTGSIEVQGTAGRGGRCTLVTPDEVEAGEHEVLFAAMDGPASVAVRDSAGRVVFEREAQRQQVPPGEGEEGEEGEVPYGATEPATVRLSAGSYTVECRFAGGRVSTARLQVAARAGLPAHGRG